MKLLFWVMQRKNVVLARVSGNYKLVGHAIGFQVINGMTFSVWKIMLCQYTWAQGYFLWLCMCIARSLKMEKKGRSFWEAFRRFMCDLSTIIGLFGWKECFVLIVGFTLRSGTYWKCWGSFKVYKISLSYYSIFILITFYFQFAINQKLLPQKPQNSTLTRKARQNLILPFKATHSPINPHQSRWITKNIKHTEKLTKQRI